MVIWRSWVNDWTVMLCAGLQGASENGRGWKGNTKVERKEQSQKKNHPIFMLRKKGKEKEFHRNKKWMRRRERKLTE